MRSILVALFAVSCVLAQQPEWAQCGGIGWTGGTTCVSGCVCTPLNDYYSQCLRGTATTTTTTSSSGPTPTTAPSPGRLPFLGGINMAGYDFTVFTDGSFNGTGQDPPVQQFSHFASQGVNVFRIPFAWQLMTPTVGGTIDSNFFRRYDATVEAAKSSGSDPYIILDLHNYARWNGRIIGQGGPTNEQYASLWSQLAAKYKDNQKIIFGIMNEPHDVPNIAGWVTSVQTVVNAIRAAGATNQYILIPGSSWSSAQALPNEAGPQLLTVTDPSGGTDRLIFDGTSLIHKYLDSDNSGTHIECTTDNVQVMQTLVNWLRANGNRQAILSETGAGNTQSCFTAFKSELSFVKSNSDSITGFTAWSAGSFNTMYELTLTPNPDGSDQPLWTQAVVPNLP